MKTMIDYSRKVRSAILGHAVADALGVPVEFQSREKLQSNPVIGMRAFGTYSQPAGTWSDDTSMTLAALDSLSGTVDFEDIMSRFLSWLDNAAYTATDEVFDFGNATSAAMYRYRSGTPALECGGTGGRDNGNGSLMRIIPFVLYAHYKMQDAPVAEKLELIHKASCLTHAHPRSQVGCGIYAFVMEDILDNPDKAAIASGLEKARRFYSNNSALSQELAAYSRIFNADFAVLPEEKISSSGYVVDSLEAALWCVLNTNSYKACVLKAVNLGSDTDTVAAIAGGLAGCIYGLDAIPQSWLDTLKKRAYIEELCRRFAWSAPWGT